MEKEAGSAGKSTTPSVALKLEDGVKLPKSGYSVRTATALDAAVTAAAAKGCSKHSPTNTLSTDLKKLIL